MFEPGLRYNLVMSFFQQTPLQFTTGPRPYYVVIWLHGLGADGHDFAGFVEALGGITDKDVRFVFPHAPMQSVTINSGMTMPSWFDLYGTKPEDPQDEIGIRRATRAIHSLIQKEQQQGIKSENIVLGGFSQGGALALHSGLSYPHRLGALVGLSTYLPLAERLATDLNAANQHTAVFLAHGTDDPTLPYAFALKSHELLMQAGVGAVLHTYTMGHSVSENEISDLRRFLSNTLVCDGLGSSASTV